jgi:hypothetical protein
MIIGTGKYIGIIECERCHAKGAVELKGGTNMENQLYGKNVNGFTRTQFDGKTYLVCVSCKDKYIEFKKSREKTMKQFVDDNF